MTESSAKRNGFAAHFVESVVLTWAGNVARIAIGLVALRLVTGAIPEAELGAYWVLTSVSALLANFADLGLGMAVARHLPTESDTASARRLMHTVLALRLASLVLLCAIVAICRPWILRILDAEVIAAKYGYLYAFIFVSSLSELYNNFLQGLNRFRAMAVYALASSVARLVLLVTFVNHMHMGVTGLFVSEIVSSAFGALLAGLSSRLGLMPTFDRARASRQLRFGFPLYLNTLLSYTSSRINTVLIGSMRNTVAVSWFSVAARVPDQLMFVLRAYIQVYLPSMTRLLTRGDTEAARRLLSASLHLMGFTFAMLALCLSFVRSELLGFLAPPSYQVASPAVPLLLGGLAFGVLGSLLGVTLVALGDSRTPVRINIWTSLIAFALNAFCIARWGFLGAAWAHFTWNVIAYGITDVVVSRRFRPAGRSYLVTMGLIGVLLIAGLRASPLLRVGLVIAAVAGCLALSPALRVDAMRVWNLRPRRTPPSDQGPA